MGIDKVVEAVESAIKKLSPPADFLPPELIWCASIKRPGGSAMKMGAEIMYNFSQFGGITGKNTDGSANMVTQFAYSIAKATYDMITKDMVVNIATPAGTVMTESGPNVNTFLSKGTMS